MKSLIKLTKAIVLGAGGWILYRALEDLYNGENLAVVGPTFLTLLVIGIIIFIVLSKIEKRV